MALFPLVIFSNVSVVPETRPGWLEALVDVSLISHLVTAARSLMDGTVPGLELTVSLGSEWLWPSSIFALRLGVTRQGASEPHLWATRSDGGGRG